MINFPLHTTRFVTAVLVDEEEQHAILRVREVGIPGTLEVELIDSEEVIHGDSVRMYEQIGTTLPMVMVEIVSKGVGVGYWSAIVDIRVLEN